MPPRLSEAMGDVRLDSEPGDDVPDCSASTSTLMLLIRRSAAARTSSAVIIAAVCCCNGTLAVRLATARGTAKPCSSLPSGRPLPCSLASSACSVSS